MTDQQLIKAPEGWLDYAAGKHFSTEDDPSAADRASDPSDYLALLKAFDLDNVPELEPTQNFSWRDTDRAALTDAPHGNKWKMRLRALSELKAPVEAHIASDQDAADLWVERVAQGRYYMNFAEALQRGAKGDVFQQANAHLDQANAAFIGLEGGDFFHAQTELIRGRLLAWKNDVIGATASQSSALSIFQKYGNRQREASAAYELAIANLDANLPDPALLLFDLAIAAHRALTGTVDSLARALQSKARALLVKARNLNDGADATPLIEEAKRNAYEAFLLSKPFTAAELHEPLAPTDPPLVPNPPKTHEGYRAAMSARDLGEAALIEGRLGALSTQAAQTQARAWLKVAATEVNLGEVFSEAGRQSFRQRITSGENVRFDVLRLAQLEFEILAQTAPDQAAPLLIETGKRHTSRSYAIECFDAAAKCFQVQAAQSDDQTLASEAEYWRHRAARVALSIGARSNNDAGVPEGIPASLEQALSLTRAQQEFQIVRYETATADGLHAEVILSGRQTANRLVILPPESAAWIKFDLLSAIADRGDIPQISYGGVLETGALYLIQELPSGRALSQTLGRDLSTSTRVRLAARLCRALAGLLRAHSGSTKSAPPLYITLEDIILEPGNRAVITRFGPIGRNRSPNLAWSFLYPSAEPGSSKLKDGVDAQALAKMLIILLGVEKTQHRGLRAPSYVRRALAWFEVKTPIDALSFDALEALGKLANGNLKVSRSYEKSLRNGAEIEKREVKGVAELLYLASLLDTTTDRS